jgi:predicted RNA methylase
MDCCRGACEATAAHFDRKVAEDNCRRYRTKGLDKRASRLVEALVRTGIAGASVLDVGSGIGMISIELLQRGAASATRRPTSPAYLEVARELAIEKSLAGRMQFITGDFVQTAASLSSVDVVVMDRAVCCYAAWRPFLKAASERCRDRLAMTYPRSRPDIKVAIGLENFKRRLAKDDFRAFVHPPREMAAALEASGFARVHETGTLA